MYCRHCGRETHGHCLCLGDNPISKWHGWLLYLILIVGPVVALTLAKADQSIWEIEYLLYGGFILAGILLLVTVAGVVFKKPYLALLFGCHQRQDRSISWLERGLPLCARCTGIYLGVMVVALLHVVLKIPLYVYPLLGIPLLVDGYLQQKKDIPSTNARRLATGLLFGATFVFLFTMYHVMIVWGVELMLNWITNR